ncbi:MAG TPA: DUF4185 domain-containing protein [Deltaproteobacteria bacterium]|jgi:hypothetical protein|nr:DUF4185 domain-containing protein [Deltaproteobacteria bacterium]HQI00130.1 DUF4185 domain-containing protein [Deltaproteobacteria bacterium]
MQKKSLPGSAVFFLSALLLAFLAFSIISCSKTAPVGRTKPSFELHAQRWPEAEMLFKRDRYWLGGDGAYSLILGPGRVLWLFGDSFIGNGSSRDRKDAGIVRNTIAIQKGCDPAVSSAAFYWKTVKGKPAAFFPSREPSWYWPGSGIRIRDRLLVFLMEVEPSANRLGFAPKGWDAVLVANPDEDPDKWSMTDLEAPQNRFGVIVGSACCILEGGYLYAFGADAVHHGAFLVRWRLSDAVRGKLTDIEWWTGSQGWLGQDRLTRCPDPLFPGAQMEFTVHYEKASKRFFEIQTGSFFDPCLVYRSSKSLTGPWSGKVPFYCPQEAEAKGLLVYAGKAHPGLAGADLVCTYAQNSLDQERLLKDDSLYYPVFVKADFIVHAQ